MAIEIDIDGKKEIEIQSNGVIIRKLIEPSKEWLQARRNDLINENPSRWVKEIENLNKAIILSKTSFQIKSENK